MYNAFPNDLLLLARRFPEYERFLALTWHFA